MPLPKSPYETILYLYILAGIVLLAADVHLVVGISGILLYCVGCCYWVLRSNYRREDRHVVQSQRAKFRFSALIYEALPFLYLLCGIIVLLRFSTAIELASGLLLVSAGLLVWRIRYASRLEKRRHAILRNKS